MILFILAAKLLKRVSKINNLLATLQKFDPKVLEGWIQDINSKNYPNLLQN